MPDFNSMRNFDSSFHLMQSIFPVFIILFIGLFLFVICKGIFQWSRNNNSPVLSVEARVVNMREEVHSSADHSSATQYFATFQVESSDRIELSVSGKEYGMLAQGDTGRLTFQGTRYLGFQRESAPNGEREGQATIIKVAQTCPHCGAATTPDTGGRCEFCGSAIQRMEP